MEGKSGLTSSEILESVFHLMDSGGSFDPDEPVVLSCGGIHLQGRKVPKNLVSWQTEVFLPNRSCAGIRIFRFKGESTKKSLIRILTFEAMN